MTNSPEILLIDDNHLDVELIIATFKNYKIINDILAFDDGEDALNYIFCKEKYTDRETNKIPKIILLNNKLQSSDSLKILKEIKKNDKTKKIPVVILSSSVEQEDLLDCYKLGVNSYIVKPIAYNEFSEVIHNIGLYWLTLNESPI